MQYNKEKCILRGDYMNFRYRIMQFMSGRYGADTLFRILIYSAAVLAFVNCFVRTAVIQFIVYALVIVAILRFLSRNIEARRRENNAVTGLIYGLKNKIRVHKERKSDTTHIYRKCPKCRAVLRLPRKKGTHSTVCPKCKNTFKVRVLK